MKKGGEDIKSNGCTLNFYNGYLHGDTKGPFGGNVFKNPSRYK